MEINILKTNDISIAEVTGESILINETQDALDIMANSRYQGAGSIILYEINIIPEFFDLKTKIAGDILQKFSNYRMHLAIVGDFSKYKSKSMKDFILESNKTGRINFVMSREEAIVALSKKN